MIRTLISTKTVRSRPERLRIDQRDALPNSACLLELLNPPPAGRLRQVHPRRDVGNGKRSILLQQREDFTVCRSPSNLLREIRKIFYTLHAAVQYSRFLLQNIDRSEKPQYLPYT